MWLERSLSQLGVGFEQFSIGQFLTTLRLACFRRFNLSLSAREIFPQKLRFVGSTARQKHLLERDTATERPTLNAMERQEATETSPLLAKPTATLPDPGLTPNSIPPSEIGVTAHRNRDSKPAEDEESQSNGKDRAHQYEGMPDVRARLRYIVPAVGIGVKPSSSLGCIDRLLTFFRYSFRLQTRPSSCHATGKLVAI